MSLAIQLLVIGTGVNAQPDAAKQAFGYAEELDGVINTTAT
jgi:hypothetical protein